jgi:hypothetical protein
MTMRRIAVLTAITILVSGVATAQAGIGGYLQTDLRLQTGGDNMFSWNENRLALTLSGSPTTDAHYYGELWLSTYGLPEVSSSSNLTEPDRVSPWGFDLREAYVDLYGFIFPSLDIRVGRQRIAWGTADKLNPTDNLNPDDLRDIWDFGRHLGSDALKAMFYWGDFTFTGAYIPTFRPAVLPTGEWAAALAPPMELPPGLTLRNLTDTINMPVNNPKHASSGGVRIATALLDYDLSLSYVYARDDLPLADSIAFIPVDTLGTVDVTSRLLYPRMQVVGADLAGDVFGVGVWAEAAMFLPDEVVMTLDLTALGMGTQDSTVLADEPYLKYVLGADYTFKNGIYVNMQYLHGFAHERGRAGLEDYVMLGAEMKFFNDRLTLRPIAGGLAIKDYGDIANSYAVLYGPELAYHPVDNAEILLGAHIIEGKATTAFGRMKDNDEAYLKVKYSF